MTEQKLLLQNNPQPFSIIWKGEKYYVDWDLYNKVIAFKEIQEEKYASKYWGWLPRIMKETVLPDSSQLPA